MGPLRWVLFDWGDTLMSEDGPADLPMALWPEVRVLDGAAETLAALAARFRLGVPAAFCADDGGGGGSGCTAETLTIAIFQSLPRWIMTPVTRVGRRTGSAPGGTLGENMYSPMYQAVSPLSSALMTRPLRTM